jgi:hypothetical protein
VRVSKRRARKLYDEGKTIRILPVKVYVDNNMFALEINKNDKFEVEPFDWELKFDSRVNRFEFYNCQYNETGKYSAFYIRKEAIA